MIIYGIDDTLPDSDNPGSKPKTERDSIGLPPG